MNRRITGSALVRTVAALVLAGAAGCGSAVPMPGRDAAPVADAAAATAPSRAETLCSSWVDLEASGGNTLLGVNLTWVGQERVQRAVRQFWSLRQPILASMHENAPDEIRDATQTMVFLADRGAVDGDPTLLWSPALKEANRSVGEYMLAQCGFPHVTVTATDSSFSGLPAELPGGTLAITLTNRGRYIHQLVVSRIDDDLSIPYTDVLALLDDGNYQTAPVKLAFTNAEPGESTTVFLRLEPGRYGVADFFTGRTTRFDVAGTGPPNYRSGLVGEFGVAGDG
ncbi:hypothetical protein [Pseudonocardia charpentierae]|uniref:Uncharacterized protein n=1 Tax=Pseudonocardia charpentierae TaxID=3075545 RepID=A0ABU2NID0_9PSEU|nr:hypothetical protein [Pseudonocardia sp. DSM 45834]MDT0353506.1 hypothetical protein [Pseudonocardia sp. DSM 45834]